MDEELSQGEAMASIPIPRGVNLNTVVIIVGFLSTFTAVVWSWSNLQNEQHNFSAFIEEQKAFNAKVDERFRAGVESFAVIPQLGFQVSALETSVKANEERLTRVSESNSSQFFDMRAQLGSISTQVALVKQSLDRIEAWSTTDAPRPRVSPRMQ